MAQISVEIICLPGSLLRGNLQGDVNAHLALWRPVLHSLLRKLAREAEGPLVFLLLGRKAQRIFAASGAEEEAVNHVAGGRNYTVRVDLPHPRAADFFIQNPWLRVSEGLGASHIDWWPPVPEVGL